MHNDFLIILLHYNVFLCVILFIQGIPVALQLIYTRAGSFLGGYSCANISRLVSECALQPVLHGNKSVVGYKSYPVFAIVATLSLVESVRP